MDATQTHVSQMFQGTLTHMSPEMLTEGRASKAADVYAFGITLYELFTGGTPYACVPKALLPHKIVAEGVRPQLPPACPPALRTLMAACWHQDPDARYQGLGFRMERGSEVQVA